MGADNKNNAQSFVIVETFIIIRYTHTAHAHAYVHISIRLYVYSNKRILYIKFCLKQGIINNLIT